MFAVDDMTRLWRFCILGVEGGTYYASERQLKLENAQAVARLVESGRVAEAVGELVAISEAGRAPKQDATIFALAALARLGKTAEERKVAFEAIGRVCRIPTHLFGFVANSESIVPGSSGWGRMMRSAVAKWYNAKRPEALAMALTKYQQRDGWSHRASRPGARSSCSSSTLRGAARRPSATGRWMPASGRTSRARTWGAL